jgi:hypothetical protein
VRINCTVELGSLDLKLIISGEGLPEGLPQKLAGAANTVTVALAAIMKDKQIAMIFFILTISFVK